MAKESATCVEVGGMAFRGGRHVTRIGDPTNHFPYWVETPDAQFIVYARNLRGAANLFYAARPAYEPMVIRQMADNE